MLNQFGQDIQVGDWVGWASKTGSHTTRKIGVVTRFGQRDIGYNSSENVAYVDWLYDGSYSGSGPAQKITNVTKSTGVGITRLFKLDFDPERI